ALLAQARGWPAAASTRNPSSPYRLLHPPAQEREDLRFEPGIAFQPGIVAPRRVRQRQYLRDAIRMAIRTPCLHRLGHAAATVASQMPSLCILADRQDELDTMQPGEEFAMPAPRAFTARRQIAACIIETWKAEPHRH